MGVAKISTKLDYDPWGLTLKGLTYTNPTLNKNNFQFGSKEKIESSGLNWIDFGARIYMPDVPHFITIDPLAEISRRFSPYVYANDNPIRFIDPDGMYTQESQDVNSYEDKNGNKVYYDGNTQKTLGSGGGNEGGGKDNGKAPTTELQFDQQGTYLGAVNDGKKEFSGSIVDKKGNVTSRFEFNDQSDGENIMSGGIIKLDLRFSAMINIFMSKAGVNGSKSFMTRYFYAFFNSLAGESMDFVQYLAKYSKTDKVLYLAGNRAYNNYDAGNFLWGRAMNTIGIGYTGSQIGSEANGFLFGKRQNGQGMGVTWGGDSKEDQKAILHGYYWYLYKQQNK